MKCCAHCVSFSTYTVNVLQLHVRLTDIQLFITAFCGDQQVLNLITFS